MTFENDCDAFMDELFQLFRVDTLEVKNITDPAEAPKLVLLHTKCAYMTARQHGMDDEDARVHALDKTDNLFYK